MDRNYTPGPEICNGHNPTDLPQLKIATYPTGPHTITAACTGPDDGLTGIKRSKLHLSASYADDIDFIDTIQETDCYEVRKSINTTTSRTHPNKIQRFGSSRRLSNGASSSATTSDQNANKTSGSNVGGGGGGGGGMRSRKNSKSSISNLSQSTKDGSSSMALKNTSQKNEENSNKSTTVVVSMVSSAGKSTSTDLKPNAANDQNNKNLLNTKTETETSLQHKSKENGENLKSDGDTTTKILEDTTERLLREAVSNQVPVVDADDVIAGVSNWKMESDLAYGISVSLYENNMLTKEPMGNPIADCYGMVVRGNAAVMALADGVNWGDGARLAARSAVHGCLDYLDRAIFGFSQECTATTTQEVFVSLLRSLWEGHGCILEVGGALSTLTIAVVLPLAKDENDAVNGDGDMNEKYVVCACNVGDSLGYVYSKKHGVREFTLGNLHVML